MVIALVMVISGCGLKGDLYLDKPDSAEAEGSATSTDAETTSDWTDRLQIEGNPASGSQGTEALEGFTAESPEASAEMSDPASATTDPDTTVTKTDTTNENAAIAGSVTTPESKSSAEEVEAAPGDSVEPIDKPENTELETDSNISEPATTLAPEGAVPAP